MAVYLELSPGDTLVIGNSRIRVERKTGQRTRVAIDSTEDVERIKAGEPVPAQQQNTQPAAQPAAAAPATPVLRRPVSNPAAN